MGSILISVGETGESFWGRSWCLFKCGNAKNKACNKINNGCKLQILAFLFIFAFLFCFYFTRIGYLLETPLLSRISFLLYLIWPNGYFFSSLITNFLLLKCKTSNFVRNNVVKHKGLFKTYQYRMSNTVKWKSYVHYMTFQN